MTITLIILITTCFIGSAQDFEVSPVKMSFSVEPGNIESKNLMITNHSSTTQSFQLSIGSSLPARNNTEKIDESEIDRSCADWITIAPSFFQLNPNESKNLDISMQVPGGNNSTKWCMIYVRVVKEQVAPTGVDKQVAAGIIISPRIGVYVVQSPKTNTNYSAKISSFIEDESKDSLRTFAVTLENTGDKAIEGNVYLLISNLETAKEQKLSPLREGLLPGYKKTVYFKLPGDVSSGKYALAAIMDYGHNTSLEGAQLIIEVP
jgi:P pilus assembly chaperone PapD